MAHHFRVLYFFFINKLTAVLSKAEPEDIDVLGWVNFMWRLSRCQSLLLEKIDPLTEQKDIVCVMGSN
jgi:hypothetical protein